MTRTEALAVVEAAMAQAQLRTNPLWHDIGGGRRNVGKLNRGVAMQIACLEPFVSSRDFAWLHGRIKSEEGTSTVSLPYVELESMAAALRQTNIRKQEVKIDG